MKAQQTRPLIGINADFVPATKTAGAQARVNVGYFDSVLAAGGFTNGATSLSVGKTHSCAVNSSRSTGRQRHGQSLVNRWNRRTPSSRRRTVASPRLRHSC